MVHQLHVITAVLVILAPGRGGLTAAASIDLPLIQWPVGCSQYTEPVSEYPRVDYIDGQEDTNVSSCRSLCTSRQDCGGFAMWVWPDGSPSCELYNINDDVISDHLSDNWWDTDSSYTWHSKMCRPYSVGDISCNEYKDKYEENQRIWSSVWRITYTWPSIPNLTPGQCQTWCTLYPGCRSVVYNLDISDGSGTCRLYTTTIEELLGSGHSGDVLQNTDSRYTYTTYDRYCPDTDLPYMPNTR